MGKRLKSYVHVLGDDGENYVYGPEDSVPKAHAEKIGDHAWVDEDEPLEDNRRGVVVENDGQAKPKRPAAGGGSGQAKAPARAKAPSRRSRSSAGGASAGAGSSGGGKADGAGDGGASAGPDGSDGSGSGD